MNEARRDLLWKLNHRVMLLIVQAQKIEMSGKPHALSNGNQLRKEAADTLDAMRDIVAQETLDGTLSTDVDLCVVLS